MNGKATKKAHERLNCLKEPFYLPADGQLKLLTSRPETSRSRNQALKPSKFKGQSNGLNCFVELLLIAGLPVWDKPPFDIRTDLSKNVGD